MTDRPSIRSGITLMEVILALAIFVGSLFVISQLVGHGTRAIERARLETSASLLAESKMSEVTSGILPVVEGGARFTDQPQWRWQLSTSDGGVAGLKRIRVVVFPSPDGALSEFAGSFHFALDRWLFVVPSDPSQPSQTHWPRRFSP